MIVILFDSKQGGTNTTQTIDRLPWISEKGQRVTLKGGINSEKTASSNQCGHRRRHVLEIKGPDERKEKKTILKDTVKK